jgi:hypothetical protein
VRIASDELRRLAAGELVQDEPKDPDLISYEKVLGQE